MNEVIARKAVRRKIGISCKVASAELDSECVGGPTIRQSAAVPTLTVRGPKI
jgi:hypothetical protein